MKTTSIVVGSASVQRMQRGSFQKLIPWNPRGKMEKVMTANAVATYQDWAEMLQPGYAKKKATQACS